VTNLKEQKMLVSDSLSFGMREALENDCAGEVIFVTGAVFRNEEELEQIIGRYSEIYWKKCPEAADATRKAFAEGRILMPKAEDCCHPIGSSGMPLYTSFEEWQWEVARHAPEWAMAWCHTNLKGKVTSEQVMATKTPQELYRLFQLPVGTFTDR
jgi:hypothetical protein